jgi:hypothetical protein
MHERRALAHARVAHLCVPLHADQPCGDATAALALDGSPDDALLLMVDGLGHGPQAAHAAQRGVAAVAARKSLPLPRLMTELDDSLRDTRGAAVGLMRVRATPEGGSLAFAGVGNTRALRWRGPSLHRLASQYGVVGGGLAQPVAVQVLDLAPGDWVLMFSDGLDERLKLPAPLPEWQRDPGLLCAHLARHWRQGADDIGVLACHWPLPADGGAPR